MFARVPGCGEIVILPDSVRLVYKQSVVTRNRRQARVSVSDSVSPLE